MRAVNPHPCAPLFIKIRWKLVCTSIIKMKASVHNEQWVGQYTTALHSVQCKLNRLTRWGWTLGLQRPDNQVERKQISQWTNSSSERAVCLSITPNQSVDASCARLLRQKVPKMTSVNMCTHTSTCAYAHTHMRAHSHTHTQANMHSTARTSRISIQKAEESPGYKRGRGTSSPACKGRSCWMRGWYWMSG